jgi:AcrR family transcriptional regulator
MTASKRARPEGTRQARADRTRSALIAETIGCILEEGFSSASTNRILERAGVTWGVVQYHFKDRDGLLLAVVDEGFAGLRRSLEKVSSPSGPLDKRVQAVVEGAWVAFSQPASIAALEILIATRGQRPREMHQHLMEINRQLESLGTTLVDSPASAGVARLLWAALRGFALVRMVVGSWDIDDEEDRARLADMITTYLAAAT